MPTAIVSPPTPAGSLPLRWLDSHGDRLYAYAIGRVRRPEIAEDLVQETLLAAVESEHRYQGRSGVGTWLTGILRNKINDHLRARYRHGDTESLAAGDEAMFDRRGRWKTAVPRWRGDPAHLAEQAEFRGVIDSCITKLPKSMAYVFLSRVADDVDTTQLCAELSIKPENAWKLLHRARSRLRECLILNWFTEPGKPGTGRRSK